MSAQTELVLTKSVADQNYKTKFGTVVTQFSEEELTWKWTFQLTVAEFEEIHGISRVLKLLPDKCHTALLICKEELPDPLDDGSFMINLVAKLLLFYRDMHSKRTRTEADPELSQCVSKQIFLHTFRQIGQEEVSEETEAIVFDLDFLQMIQDFLNDLKTIKVHLRARHYELAESVILTTLKKADCVMACINIYLSFIHPSIIWVKRNGTLEDEKFKAYCEQTQIKYEKGLCKSFVNEYLKLCLTNLSED